MSVLRRPHGDTTAQKFGAYKTENEVRRLVAGDKLDVLCDGGIHYVAKVVSIDQSLNGQLHFCKWNEKYDHFGSYKELYLADAGQYSAGTLNGANQYIDPNDVSSSRKKINQSVSEDGGGTGPSYAEKTRYEDDYLFKPYRSDRKRRSLDGVIQQTRENENRREDEISPPPTKKANVDTTVTAAVQAGGESGGAAATGAVNASNQPSPAVTDCTIADAPSFAPSSAVSSGSVEVDQALPIPAAVSDPDPIGGPSVNDQEGLSNLGNGEVERSRRGNLSGSQHSAVPGRQDLATMSGPGVSLRGLQPARAKAEYVSAPNPFVVSGGRTLPLWRHFYQQMLQDSGDAECRDVAAAMEWLNAHLDTARGRGTLKGKVYGPLAMLCVTYDVHSAVMLEHAMGRRLLLGFLVDRLQDQQYLEDQFVHKQGLKVTVLFSGTRDRFDGYKALAPTYANPATGCELTTLGDRLMCGQLIRNLMHSEGCTGQMVLGGTLAAGTGMDGSAALKNVFSRAGASHAGKVVVYLAEDGGSEHHVRRYTYEQPGAAAGSAAAQVKKEPIPLLPSQPKAGESLRLLYSYSEQLERAETVPAHLVTVSAAHAPSMSSKHSSTALPSYTTQARAAASGRTSYGASVSNPSTAAPAVLAPHHAHLAAQSFLGLEGFNAARVAAGAMSLRTASGGIAVWHLLRKQPGLWFPSRPALVKDLQQQPANGGAGVSNGTDAPRSGEVPALDAQGLYVPLSVFMQHSSPDNGELGGEPTLFGHTWPLELASFPIPASAVNSAIQEAGADPAGVGVPSVEAKVEGTSTEAVSRDPAGSGVGTCVEAGGGWAMCVEAGKRDSPLPLGIAPAPLPLLPLDIGSDLLPLGTEAGVESGPAVDGEEDRNGTGAAAGGRGGGQDEKMEQEGSGRAVQGGGPHLAVNKKTGVAGLAFLTSDAFRVWHKAVLAENGEDFELAVVAADKAAFLALASIRGSAEYYDLRLLKRKHAVLFWTGEPKQAAAVCALLRRNSEAVARSEYSLRNGARHSHNQSGSSASRAGGLSPLPLSVLMRSGGPSMADMLSAQPRLPSSTPSWRQQQEQQQQQFAAPLPRPDLTHFRAQLANDATIAKLESSLNHLGAFSSELVQAGVDAECLRKLLSAQLQLARATRLVLK